MSSRAVDTYLKLDAQVAELHANNDTATNHYDELSNDLYCAWLALTPAEETIVSLIISKRDAAAKQKEYTDDSQ